MTDRRITEHREEATWRAYRAELLAFACSRLREDAAEDLVQEVLAKGYAARRRLRDETKLRAWLYQIMRNALVDSYREANPVEVAFEDLEDREDDAGSSPASVEEELARCLAPMIQHLPSGYREAVVLSELQGVRQKDVAETLGLSFSGAKSRVQRGRNLLRAMLADCCDVRLDARGRPMDHHCRSGCGCR